MTNQHAWISIPVDWLTHIPAYTSLSIRVDWPTNIPIYPELLTNQHTWLSGLTARPTYRPSIWADWLTNIPDYLPLLKFVYCLCVVSGLPVHAYYPPSYKDWLTSAFLFYLLIIISAYLSGPTDWPTSCYLRIYIWADCLSVWLTIMPVFLSCIPVWVNYRHTYMPTYLSWLRNISAFLSCLTYQGWLTDQRTCLPAWADSYQTYRLGLTDQHIYQSTYQSWLR